MGYPTTTQTSGQFSFNSFRQWWTTYSGAPGTDYGNHLNAWRGQSYATTSNGLAAGTFPASVNMNMKSFYGKFAPGTGSGGGGK